MHECMYMLHVHDSIVCVYIRVLFITGDLQASKHMPHGCETLGAHQWGMYVQPFSGEFV